MATRVNVATGSTGGASLTVQTTPGVNHSVLGNLLVAAIGWEDQGGLSTVTDLAGNTWTALPSYPAITSSANIAIAWTKITAAHASNVITATFNNSNAAWQRIIVAQYDLQLPVFEAINGASSSGTVDPWPTGSISLAGNNDVIIAAGKGYQAQSFTPGSGWTEVIEVPSEFVMNEKLDAGAGSISTDIDPNVGSAYACAIAAWQLGDAPVPLSIFDYAMFPKHLLRRSP